jgi:hypothetical protein
MRVFVDRSVIEVYMNGNAITKVAHVEPTARHVAVFAEGGTRAAERIDAWEMGSMWRS